MDRIDRERRSWNMSRIGGKDTSPELKVRSLLHRLGFRFRLHRKDLPGTPDIVIPKHHTVVFVHGCFWHRHPNCKFAYTPKTNVQFWEKKFSANVARDTRNEQALKAGGWNVVYVWECETSDIAKLAGKLKRMVERKH